MFLPSRRNIPQGKIQYNISISININLLKFDIKIDILGFDR